MEKGYINIDENEIHDITTHLGKNISYLSNLGQSSDRKFEPLKKANLFGSGITKINKQVASVSNSVYRMNESIKNKTNEMIELDNSLQEEADKITVPMDFVTNDTVRSHIFDGIVLQKEDGKNVKDDNSLYDNELHFDSTISENTLKDITTEEQDFNNIKLKDYKIKSVNMGNINNTTETETSELQYSEEGIIPANLKNIEQNNALRKIDLDDSSVIENVYFYDDFYDEKKD